MIGYGGVAGLEFTTGAMALPKAYGVSQAYAGSQTVHASKPIVYGGVVAGGNLTVATVAGSSGTIPFQWPASYVAAPLPAYYQLPPVSAGGSSSTSAVASMPTLQSVSSNRTLQSAGGTSVVAAMPTLQSVTLPGEHAIETQTSSVPVEDPMASKLTVVSEANSEITFVPAPRDSAPPASSACMSGNSWSIAASQVSPQTVQAPTGSMALASTSTCLSGESWSITASQVSEITFVPSPQAMAGSAIKGALGAADVRPSSSDPASPACVAAALAPPGTVASPAAQAELSPVAAAQAGSDLSRSPETASSSAAPESTSSRSGFQIRRRAPTATRAGSRCGCFSLSR